MSWLAGAATTAGNLASSAGSSVLNSVGEFGNSLWGSQGATVPAGMEGPSMPGSGFLGGLTGTGGSGGGFGGTLGNLGGQYLNSRLHGFPGALMGEGGMGSPSGGFGLDSLGLSNTLNDFPMLKAAVKVFQSSVQGKNNTNSGILSGGPLSGMFSGRG